MTMLIFYCFFNQLQQFCKWRSIPDWNMQAPYVENLPQSLMMLDKSKSNPINTRQEQKQWRIIHPRTGLQRREPARRSSVGSNKFNRLFEIVLQAPADLRILGTRVEPSSGVRTNSNNRGSSMFVSLVKPGITEQIRNRGG